MFKFKRVQRYITANGAAWRFKTERNFIKRNFVKVQCCFCNICNCFIDIVVEMWNVKVEKLRRMQLQKSVCDKKREKAILQKQLINHLLKSRLLWIDKYVCRWSTKHYIVPVLLISVCYNFSRFYELSCVPYKCLFFWIVNKLNKMLHYKNSKFQLI